MRRAIVFLFGILVISIQAQTTQNIVKVTVDGYSYLGENETMLIAKERAMQDAEKNAIEKGTKIYIESYSKVHNSMLVDDYILSISKGYLLNKTIVIDRLESDPPRYHIQIEAEVKGPDLEKLIQELKDRKNPKAISLDFAVVAERKMADGSWGEVIVKDGSALRSYDKFQILIKPNMDCYVYLLFYDSESNASLLFPDKENGKDNFLNRDKKIFVPGNDLFYELDDKTGQETVYLIASASPMSDLDWLLEKMEKAGNKTQLAANLVKSAQSRGIGNVVHGEKIDFKLTDGKIIEKVTEVVKGKGSFVRVLSFMHQP